MFTGCLTKLAWPIYSWCFGVLIYDFRCFPPWEVVERESHDCGCWENWVRKTREILRNISFEINDGECVRSDLTHDLIDCPWATSSESGQIAIQGFAPTWSSIKSSLFLFLASRKYGSRLESENLSFFQSPIQTVSPIKKIDDLLRFGQTENQPASKLSGGQKRVLFVLSLIALSENSI